MNEQDKAAFDAWAEERGVWPRLTHGEIWQAACEYKDKQAAQAEPVAAKYYAMLDESGKHIKMDTITGQLEIYEDQKFVPKINNTLVEPVYIAKTRPSAEVVRELMSAYGSTRMSLQMFSATFDKCGFVPSEATKNLVDRALQSIDSALKSAKEHGL